MAIPSNVESALSLAAEAARLSDAGLSPTAVNSAMALVPVQLLAPPNPKDNENLFASLALGIILWIALGQYGNMVAQGVVEEKATRIMEILLATIQPSRLLAGKVIGIGLVGLLQLTIVGAAALVAVHVTNVAAIPALGVASILGDIFWFLLGFLFYATAYCRGRLPRLAPGGGPGRRRADLDPPDRRVPAHVRRAAESEWPPGHGVARCCRRSPPS
jgi:ABC-type Na+ efflux pump permease subunit